MSSEVPSDLKYSKSHEWLRIEDDEATIGITDHAQALLGDLVFVELPEVGSTLDAEEASAVVESVKAASDIYAPMAGEVIEVNDSLADAPENVNEEPYGEGWIYKLRLDNIDAQGDLMNAEDYEAFLESEED